MVVKARPGMGKRTLLAKVREALGDQRICLAPSVATSKQMAADLAEQESRARSLIDTWNKTVGQNFSLCFRVTGG